MIFEGIPKTTRFIGLSVIRLAFALAAVSRCASGTDLDVWAVPSIHKVRPDDPAQSRNAVWDGASRTISVAGARNEHVPFQVVISAQPPKTRNDPAASGFFVTASDLVSTAGRIPSSQIKLYFEHDILCQAPSSPVGAGGFWPDALAPLTDPFTMEAGFRQVVKNRPIWIDIITPADAHAGIYTGTVHVTQNGRPVSDLNTRLTVYDFALPTETHLITYMGVGINELTRFHKVSPTSVQALLRKYHAFLYENRMEPWFNEALQPRITQTGSSISLQFDDEAYDLYINRWKTKRVILESVPHELAADPQKIRSYVQQVVDYYRKNGWVERLVLNSPIDEPSSAQAFEDTRRWAALVHQAAPGVHFLATKTPVPENPTWGTLSGYVNDFSIHGNDLNDVRAEAAMAVERSRKGELTWYISCDQVYPQPNYFIDAPAMDPVMVPWITWRYGLQGILYWDLKFWSQTVDPWLNPTTYLSGYLCSDGRNLNGEGSLLYPGSEVRRHTGQKDVDGPVSSIRFELLREGIEDYEYLWMLKSLGDAPLADEVAHSLVATVGAFSRNPDLLYAARQKMASRIEQLTRRQ
jgi:Domain of unknown function (DUF4091)